MRVICLCVLLALFGAGCFTDPCAVRRAHVGRTLSIVIDPALADAIVTTEGACTPASCRHQEPGGGCTIWESEMTGQSGSICTVTLELTDGTRFERTAQLEETCGDLLVVPVRFEVDAGL